MVKKRSRLEVIHDILHTINKKGENIKPTHIMYKSNLSHQMMQEYLKELLEKNFIEENKSKKGKTYFLTKKGKDYLSKYNSMISFMDSFGLN